MKVCKIFHFEAAHQLKNHAGQCAFLHGHSYKVEIELEGSIHHRFDSTDSSAGMVIDFSDVSTFWKEHLEQYLDHSPYGTLNEVLHSDNPTAEYIAAWITTWFVGWHLPIVSTKVWETETAWALCSSDDRMVTLILNQKILEKTINMRLPIRS